MQASFLLVRQIYRCTEFLGIYPDTLIASHYAGCRLHYSSISLDCQIVESIDNLVDEQIKE